MLTAVGVLCVYNMVGVPPAHIRMHARYYCVGKSRSAAARKGSLDAAGYKEASCTDVGSTMMGWASQ